MAVVAIVTARRVPPDWSTHPPPVTALSHRISTLLACIALTAACVVPESVGYVDGLPGAAPANNGSNGGERPQNGSCVTFSDCAVGQECCRGACVGAGRCPESAVCTAQGQVCELPSGSGYEVQGDFICARLAGAPTCLEHCTEPFAASTCSTGSYCFEVNAGAELLQVCVESECSASLDCEDQGTYGGSCIGFGNEAGFCFAAGTAQRGQPCDPSGSSPAGTCSPDLYCLNGSTGPVCRALCDMWNTNGNRCGVGEVCGFLTAGQGACATQTATGRLPFEECAPESDWCDNGVACLDFGTGGESLVVCAAYCRPGVPSDCTGARFQGRAATCQTVFSNSNGEPLDDVGLCL